MKTWPLQFSRRNPFTMAADTDPCSGLSTRYGSTIKVPYKMGTLPVARGVTQRLTKLLLNVHVEESVGPLHLLMSPENAVRDLVKAAIEMYVREKRRPLLRETDEQMFNLHYSQFSLESLKREEKLINLGSRNFYLCRKPKEVTTSSYNLDKSC